MCSHVWMCVWVCVWLAGRHWMVNWAAALFTIEYHKNRLSTAKRASERAQWRMNALYVCLATKMDKNCREHEMHANFHEAWCVFLSHHIRASFPKRNSHRVCMCERALARTHTSVLTSSKSETHKWLSMPYRKEYILGASQKRFVRMCIRFTLQAIKFRPEFVYFQAYPSYFRCAYAVSIILRCMLCTHKCIFAHDYVKEQPFLIALMMLVSLHQWL